MTPLTREQVESRLYACLTTISISTLKDAIRDVLATDAALRQQLLDEQCDVVAYKQDATQLCQQLLDEQSLHHATQLCLTAQTESVLKCAEKVQQLTARLREAENEAAEFHSDNSILFDQLRDSKQHLADRDAQLTEEET
jgi:Na+/phosphate symporter